MSEGHRHICMNGECVRYLEVFTTKYRVGERVQHADSGREGTVETVICPFCDQPMELERA